jgi:flagellar hook-associated protein 2
VDAYNACADELDKQHGETAGALAGHSVVSTLTRALRSLTAYKAASGTVGSLAAVGVELDRYGHLSLDSAGFETATANGLSDALEFLGGATTGFLGSGTAILDGLEDPISGLLQCAMKTLQSELNRQDELIAENEDRIERLRESLQAQMARADALIASLEQQANYFNNLFETMRINASNQA